MKNYKNKAQTASELAIFGSILIFVVGLIIRQGLGASYVQNQNLKAMRIALAESYKSNIFNVSARNFASILFIEDRLTTNFGKYGALNRVPFIVSGGGSHTNNFFMPTSWGEQIEIPVMDVFVNGKHFTFRTANYVEHNTAPPADPSSSLYIQPSPYKLNCAGGNPCTKFYKIVPNIPDETDWCTTAGSCPTGLAAEYRFDLDRDGDLPLPFGPDTDDPPQSIWATFSWQWDEVEGVASNISIDDNKNTVLDVDGDFKEERILGLDTNNNVITKVQVVDNQAGDIDFTHNPSDGGPPPGFRDDMQVFTFTKEGTYLEIREGKLYTPGTNQFVRSTNRKDQVDIIQRVMQLSNDTKRYCNLGAPVAVVDPGLPTLTLNLNPVEACDFCFNQNFIDKTCFDPNTKLLYIRSRIQDLGGHKWVTDVTSTTP